MIKINSHFNFDKLNNNSYGKISSTTRKKDLGKSKYYYPSFYDVIVENN